MVIINGSMRENGVSGQIVHRLMEQTPHMKDISIAQSNIHFCTACDRCKTASCIWHDDVDMIFDTWQKAQKIIIIVPVYWGGVPAKFKALLDRAQMLCKFSQGEQGNYQIRSRLAKGKQIVLVALSGNDDLAETQPILLFLERFFRHLGQKHIVSAGFAGTDHQAEMVIQKAVDFLKEYVTHA